MFYIYLLSAYHVSCTILGTEDAALSKKDSFFFFLGSYVLAGEANNIKNISTKAYKENDIRYLVWKGNMKLDIKKTWHFRDIKYILQVKFFFSNVSWISDTCK